MNKPQTYGKYQLIERVNVGGMAEVFKAKAFGVEGFERIVALKRILPSIAADQEFIGMFIDEAKLAVQLTHENIARIFELGYEQGTHYIEMEFVAGKDARALIDRTREAGQRLPIPLAVYVAMKACAGLDYAHEKRDPMGRPLDLVHRDVSPQNVLISYGGEIKIIDFGIAKAASQAQQTQIGILKGKFGYMSPEQSRGLPLDRRSDVFAAGILLFELLSGERLFYGDTDIATLEMVRNAEVRSLRGIRPDVPPELERIVMGALTRHVEDRYQTAMDLHDELRDFIERSGARFGERELGEHMRAVFAAEVARDPSLSIAPSIRPPRRSSLPSMPAVPAAPPPAPVAIEWEDDEATTVYDKDADLAAPPLPSRVGSGPMGAPRSSLPETVPMPAPRVSVPPAAPSTLPPMPRASAPAAPSAIPSTPPSAAPRASASAPVAPRAGAPSPFDDLPAHAGSTASLRKAEPTELIAVQPSRRSGATPYLIAAVVALAAVAGVTFAYLRPPTPGTIQLRTQPVDAEVYFDEVQLGASSSPFTITGVRPKEMHLLEVRSPGYNSWVSPVELTPGQTLDVGEVVLVASGPDGAQEPVAVAAAQAAPADAPAAPAAVAALAAEAVPTAVAAAEPVVAPEAAPAAPAAAAPAAAEPARPRTTTHRTREEPNQINSFVAGNGTLRINSRPASEVFVDGRSVGHTPQMAITLVSGRHRVRLVNAEFGLERTITVTINGGQTETRVIDLTSAN